LSLLVLTGIRDLAERQKEAVARLIAPRVQAGQRVLYLGQWGFHWYAELAGAQPATEVDPLPKAGDIVVTSYADAPFLTYREFRRTVLDDWEDDDPGGRVMDFFAGAGFFSNGWGALPWVWGTGETNRFEVWKVE
jgi:hypothetical protein